MNPQQLEKIKEVLDLILASLADIRAKPKFFTLKKNFDKGNLCEICQSHKIIVAVKWGCDYIITTDLNAQDKQHLNTNLHVWCEDKEGLAEAKDYSPPECFREYQDSGYVT